MYNSDTVYSTTTFRPVSPLPPRPPPPPAARPSPQRTRKLETPLHFDGGLFSDIRSPEGKLLSKVTVDRVHSSMRRDVTDEPSSYESTGPHGNKDFVDDFVKTETITNEDVIKVKFTPIPMEVDAPRLLTPSQFINRTSAASTPVEFIKDTFEDLQSYKIVNSICKEKLREYDHVTFSDGCGTLDVNAPIPRAPSPLANFLVSEQLTKIDNYLQESLDACTGGEGKGRLTPTLTISTESEHCMKLDLWESKKETFKENYSILGSTTCNFYQEETFKNRAETPSEIKHNLPTSETYSKEDKRKKSNSSSVKESPKGVLQAIYNMPIHYHAMIICFLLIVYNLVYQYIKQNCLGNKK